MTQVEAHHRDVRASAVEFDEKEKGKRLRALYESLRASTRTFEATARDWKRKGVTGDGTVVCMWTCPFCGAVSESNRGPEVDNARRHLASTACWLDKESGLRDAQPKRPLGGQPKRCYVVVAP
jgi:hypothetical protein